MIHPEISWSDPLVRSRLSPEVFDFSSGSISFRSPKYGQTISAGKVNRNYCPSPPPQSELGAEEGRLWPLPVRG